MKQIILMRHGKSSWEYDVSDKDRPLKERGISDAYLVARKFVTQKIVPDAIFSSPANRALHTGIIFLRNMGYDLSVLKIQEELYDFSGNQVSKFIKGLDNKLGTAMIFGHNYALTTLANTWGDTYIENVPTSGLVHIQFHSDEWSKIDKGRTKQTIFPKYLKSR
ncbi:MAG: histidine phosphatase family protein [Bacteroidota bacterium]